MTRGLWPVVAALLTLLSFSPAPLDAASGPDRMIDEQLERRGIRDRRVLDAFRRVPRDIFVPDDARDNAYDDRPLPIGHGQTISQPYIVAFMTEALNLKGEERVLEIGTGSGYQAAILAELVREVYSVEIVPELATNARLRLTRAGYRNVHVKQGDGAAGWREYGPYNAVIVTAAAPRVPQPLIDQLDEGGVLVMPVGDPRGRQVLIRGVKRGGKLRSRELTDVQFVPMTGSITRGGGAPPERPAAQRPRAEPAPRERAPLDAEVRGGARPEPDTGEVRRRAEPRRYDDDTDGDEALDDDEAERDERPRARDEDDDELRVRERVPPRRTEPIDPRRLEPRDEPEPAAVRRPQERDQPEPDLERRLQERDELEVEPMRRPDARDEVEPAWQPDERGAGDAVRRPAPVAPQPEWRPDERGIGDAVERPAPVAPEPAWRPDEDAPVTLRRAEPPSDVTNGDSAPRYELNEDQDDLDDSDPETDIRPLRDE